MGHGRFGNGRLAGIHRSLLSSLDYLVNLFPVDRELNRGLDPQFDGVLVDAQDLDDDSSINDDAFVEFAR